MQKPAFQGLFSLKGRITRTRFGCLLLLLLVAFVLAFVGLEQLAGRPITLVLYPFFFWIAFSLAYRRYHDIGKSAAWLLLLMIPLLGPLWVAIELFLKGGSAGSNRFGDNPRVLALDYFQVK